MQEILHRFARFLSLFFVLGCSSIPQLSTVHAREQERIASPDLTVAISVLGLFHPKEFVVSATSGRALAVQSGRRRIILENSQLPSVSIRIDGSGLLVTAGKEVLRAGSVEITGRNDRSEDFILRIPGRIQRRYHGTLAIRPSAGDLLAVVALDLETAVASVVAAESSPDAPVEALKAYAVAARSYFVAGRGRHKNFDFCDTTHCQFFRSPPPSTTLIAQAVEATHGLVLAYQSKPFAAMYTRSCGGRTRAPSQVGIPSAAYPYYSVTCEHCRQHPVRWTSYLSAADATSLRSSDESSRLAVAKRLGWSAVPSSEFSLTKKADHVLLAGVGNGHGIGLCQAGAKAMAETGAGFHEILQHYYPNTDVVQYSGPSRN